MIRILIPPILVRLLKFRISCQTWPPKSIRAFLVLFLWVFVSVCAGARPSLDLYVMSQCPFAGEAVRSLLDLHEATKGGFDLKVSYVVEEATEAFLHPDPGRGPLLDPSVSVCGGTADGPAYLGFRSLHGSGEVMENERQAILQDFFPREVFFIVLRGRYAEGAPEPWEVSLKRAGIEPEDLESLLASGEGKKLLEREARNSKRLGIRASPTLSVNGKVLLEPPTRTRLLRLFCYEYPLDGLDCSSVPECELDFDCESPGLVGECVEDATGFHRCVFHEPRELRVTVTLPIGESPESVSGTLRFLRVFLPRLEPVYREWDAEDPKAPFILPEFRFPSEASSFPRYRSLAPLLIEDRNGAVLDSSRFRRVVLPRRPLCPGTVTILGSAFSVRAAAAREWARREFPDHVIETRFFAMESRPLEEKPLVLEPDEHGTWHLVPGPIPETVRFPYGPEEARETFFQLSLREIRPDLWMQYQKCSDGQVLQGRAPSGCHYLLPPRVLEFLQSPALLQEAYDLLSREIQWKASIPATDFGILIDNRVLVRDIR